MAKKRSYGFIDAVQEYFEQLGKKRRRKLSDAAVRREVSKFSKGISQEMKAMTVELTEGRLTIQGWYDAMRRLMKLSYRAAVDVARGGGTFNRKEVSQFANLMKSQYAFLNRFSQELRAGKKLDGRAVMRAGMYGKALRGIFENWRTRASIAMGYTEGRRRLGIAEHCADCELYAARGWVPLAEVPPIGESVCRSNCHCTIEVRNPLDPSWVVPTGVQEDEFYYFQRLPSAD